MVVVVVVIDKNKWGAVNKNKWVVVNDNNNNNNNNNDNNNWCNQCFLQLPSFSIPFSLPNWMVRRIVVMCEC